MSTSSRFLFHDKAADHQLVVVNNFLAKNNATKLEPPPYSPDLAPSDFYMFPRLKSALKVRRISYATNIRNAMDELNMVSQKG
jgi:transposase